MAANDYHVCIYKKTTWRMLKGNKEKVSIYIIIGFIFLRFIFLQIKYGLKSNQMLLNIIKCFENSMFCIFFHSRRGAAASFHAQPTVFFPAVATQS